MQHTPAAAAAAVHRGTRACCTITSRDIMTLNPFQKKKKKKLRPQAFYQQRVSGLTPETSSTRTRVYHRRQRVQRQKMDGVICCELD
ncbi:hypothetical protein E2C01_003211 [Portunus trituberculatus]|uniref:Uncharacterized protein n=1 Tax=Portunus trituberculatus TaxID=210409 RepID=A0A5B7CPL8_PORTR|nr:hypothetical protein [Portunus trituberculatus]